MAKKELANETMTQKELRAVARVTLAKFLRGETVDVNLRDAAIGALHAPDRKGE